MYDELKDAEIKQKALQWIESEEDIEYRKKYDNTWSNKSTITVLRLNLSKQELSTHH